MRFPCINVALVLRPSHATRISLTTPALSRLATLFHLAYSIVPVHTYTATKAVKGRVSLSKAKHIE